MAQPFACVVLINQKRTSDLAVTILFCGFLPGEEWLTARTFRSFNPQYVIPKSCRAFAPIAWYCVTADYLASERNVARSGEVGATTMGLGWYLPS
jgi:hypothetical protein